MKTDCCIVGGGPAGMMLGLILARAGIDVVVLEKHGDFLRDFRGDTVHPSTLSVLSELGLMETFEKLPQHRVEDLWVKASNGTFSFGNFRGLKPFSYLALVPQWDLLNLLAEAGRAYPNYQLLMNTEGHAPIEEDGHVVGVRATGPGGELEIRARLVVGSDGRHSTLREAAGFEPRDLGAPMDVLWFRLSRKPDDPEDTAGILGRGHMMILLNRGSYWQIAYLVAKGVADALRAGSLEDFRKQLTHLAPFLSDRAQEVENWDALKLLTVKVDRIPRWHRPGLLLIGDAAHAMSPVGGVGINLAVQDAVAAANLLGPVLRDGRTPSEAELAAVQKRREWPVRIIQRIQLTIQRRLIQRALQEDAGPIHIGWLPRTLMRLGFIRSLPARVFGLGFRREHVNLPPKAG